MSVGDNNTKWKHEVARHHMTYLSDLTPKNIKIKIRHLLIGAIVRPTFLGGPTYLIEGTCRPLIEGGPPKIMIEGEWKGQER